MMDEKSFKYCLIRIMRKAYDSTADFQKMVYNENVQGECDGIN